MLTNRMTIKEQAAIYLDSLAERKRCPVKPATLAAYKSYINRWIIPELGSLALQKVENGKMKSFVQKLSKLSPASIDGIANCVKAIIASAIDSNGNMLYPRKWNTEFIDAPLIDKKAQKAPIIGREAIQEAICRAPERFKPLYALLAGTGLRISEALSLQAEKVHNRSFYDPDRALIVVNSSIYNRLEQSPKTQAGVREIDIAPNLNFYLRSLRPLQGYWFNNTEGRPYSVTDSSLYNEAKKVGVPGFHSFRRFRRTHLEIENVPAGLCDFWMGHEGKEIAARYIKFGQDIQARKIWCEKAGLGFDL